MSSASNRDPRYREIGTWLRGHCATLPTGAILPSETELATQFGVSRMTARHAVQLLEQEGLVERRRGAGSYVATPPLHRAESVLRSFSQDMRLRGLEPASRILRAELGAAPRTAAILGLPVDAWVVLIDRVRYASGVAVALERVVLPGEFSGVLDADLEKDSLHAVLAEMGRRMGRATGHVTARLATAEEADLLGMTQPLALLEESRLITDLEGRRVEAAQTAYVGNRWVLDTGSYIPPLSSDEL